MGRRIRVDERLNVFMNGALVGHLLREISGALFFTYASSWLERSSSISISRQLPLAEKPYVGKLVRDFFDNLLPDDIHIREQLAARAHAKGAQAYDLLAAVGRDCVGALQFYPEGIEPGPVAAVHGKPLADEEIEALIHNLRLNPLGIDTDADFRISLAGAQSKTALLRWGKKWILPEGPTPTTHILKPAIGPIPNGPDLSFSVENEWLCLKILQAFGLPTANAEMQVFGKTNVLVVDRFDRRWIDKKILHRVPQEDLCQALGFGTELKYEAHGGPGIINILHLLNESDRRDHDRRIFLKAQIVFFLLAAIDGHAKNFSVFLNANGGFELTPLYDVMSADPHINPRTLPALKTRLAMAVGDKRKYKIREIHRKHFQQTAAKAKFADIDELLDEVVQAVPQVIEKVGSELPVRFPSSVSKPIFRGLLERRSALI